MSALRLAQPLVGELGPDLDQELDPREEAVGLLRATLSWAARHQRATRASSAPTVTALQRANGGLAPRRRRPLLMQFPVLPPFPAIAFVTASLLGLWPDM